MLPQMVQRPTADEQEVYLLIHVSPKLQATDEIQPEASTAHHRQSVQAATSVRLPNNLLPTMETSISVTIDSCEDFSGKITNQ